MTKKQDTAKARRDKRAQGPELSEWSGTVPAEHRPPLDPKTHNAALEVLALAERLRSEWPEHMANASRSIETPFPEAFLPSEDDGWATYALLTEIAHNLLGLGNWAGIREAFRGLTGTDRSPQARQAAALVRCKWARDRWRALDRRRRKGESNREHAKRVELTETRIAETLVLALSDQHRGFRKLKPRQVMGEISRQIKQRERKRFGPQHLLHGLCGMAKVWPVSAEWLKKVGAKERA